uniref:uncharacterized protein LOC113474284 n=1 Tax=Ciona intestinalis TaxID=7719 RepID=UPI000EF542D2|nr:uncharacterized protein LOC113474284 [Ciona intestinalis]|eukprot:XP_026690518.1 uncharacterized protein LOC113474284 [Ciona intestinalis]
MVGCTSGGILTPIHVQKHCQNFISKCSNSDCEVLLTTARQTNPGLECPHIESIKYAYFEPAIVLHTEFLNQMKQIGIVSEKTYSTILELQETCVEMGIPIVVQANFEVLGYHARFSYYSVYTNEEIYVDKWLRIRVMHDTETGTWSCQCPRASGTSTCLHESIAKWLAFQNNKDILYQEMLSKNEPTASQEKEMTYLLESKIIPEVIPQEYLTEDPPLSVLVPDETVCPFCSSDLEIFKKLNCTVYGINKIWKGTTMITKLCRSCKCITRFQNYKSGFHNYNNQIILSICLCLKLLKGIESHVDVETTIKILFENSETLPISHLRNGFYHFCALKDFSYDFNCLKCGHSPKILIADGNWANCCKRPVDAVVEEDVDKETVECEDLWGNYRKEIIGRGFCESTKNPWAVKITYSSISPWIGKNSRKSNMLYNTEFLKCKIINHPKSVKQSNDKSISQEQILDALHKKEPQSLQNLCDEIGICSKGSVEVLYNRLNEMVLFKDIYPKFFKRIKKCGGGVLHFRCPHGICYYFKTLLRQESARDFVDGLLSLKQQPIVFISDVASQVAHHGENRKTGMFKPHKGMLFEWSEENLQREKEGQLKPVEINLQSNAQFYSLIDRFHMRSKKKCPEKTFRSLALAKNLSLVNSSIAEQTNAQMSKDRSFLYPMKFVNFMYITRLALHMQNMHCNQKFIKNTKKLFDAAIERNVLGIGTPVFQSWYLYILIILFAIV